jgi:serine/threonine protein kinase
LLFRAGDLVAGRHKVIRFIAQGGMGEVYEVEDQVLHERVALKTVVATDDSDRDQRIERFKREVQLARRVTHPNVCRLFDVGFHVASDATAVIFLTMELLDGETLAARIRRLGRLGTTDALPIIKQLCAGLAAAHAGGIIHRDFKPENVLLVRSGDGERAVVTDFGLARPIASGDANLTETGVPVGTAAFMAPEQVEALPVTAAADLYALGVTIYQMVTGKLPFEAPTPLAAAARRLKEAPSSPRLVVPDLDPVWEAAILRCLRLAPEERFARAGDVVAALESSRPVALPRTARPSTGRSGGLLAIAGALALLLSTGALWLARRPDSNSKAAVKHAPPSVSSSRRITFSPTCDEYPSFLPDGKSLVYDGVVDGDSELLFLDIEAGTTRRLTHTPGWDYAASVSPDGKRVAWLHNDPDAARIMVANLDGSNPQSLGPGDSPPTWTADGRILAATVGKIQVLTGTTPQLVSELPKGRVISFLAAFPDGEIATLWKEGLGSATLGVGVLPTEGALRLLEDKMPSENVGLAVSGEGVYYIRRNGSTTELVRQPRLGGTAVTLPGSAPASGLAVSRDGKRLAYSTCRSRQVLETVVEKEKDQTRVRVANNGWRDGRAQLGPDGALWFASDRSGSFQIYRQAAGSDEPVAITERNTGAFGLSPDGKLIAYLGSKRDGIYVRPVAGGTARRLTDDPSDADATFTRDGKAILFRRFIDKTPSIYWVPVQGGEVRLFQKGQDFAIFHHSDRVVFTRPEGQFSVLAVCDGPEQPSQPLDPQLKPGPYGNLAVSRDDQRVLIVADADKILELDLKKPGPPSIRYRIGGADAIADAGFEADDRTILATVARFTGNLWLAEGEFR